MNDKKYHNINEWFKASCLAKLDSCFRRNDNLFDQRRQVGFTLAELLIALAILGVIATFTIPKILDSGSDTKKYAVFKESLAAIETLLTTGLMSGELSNSNINSYFLSEKLNLAKVCSANANAEGCFPQAGPRNTEPGGVFHNGLTIAGFNNHSYDYMYNNFTLDWNGEAGPNSVGDDQLEISLLFPSNGTHTCGGSAPPQAQVGNIIPGVCSLGTYTSSSSNTALYEAIFQ